MRKKIAFILFLLTISVGVASLANFVFAKNVGGSKDEIEVLNAEISARKEKIKELESSMEVYKANIKKKRLEAISLKNQMGIFENRIAQIETEIELTEEKIKEAELEIEALNISIKEKEKVIEKQKRIINKMIQRINSDDQKNYMEILLTNDSFSDFFNQLKYLENVYTDLGRSVKTMRLAKEELKIKEKEVQSRKEIYDKMKEKLVNKKKDLKEEKLAKEDLYSQTKSSESRYRTLLKNLKQKYQAIENEVRAYEIKVRKKLEEQKKNNKLFLGDSKFIWPVPSRYITSYFHDPDYPYRKVFEHNALDIRASQGTPLRAAASGYVARAKRCTLASCYSYILLVHTGNLSTLYGHVSKILVNADQFVNKGDIIGYTGGTPGTAGAGRFVTGPHLHFETRLNGIPVDPLPYLPK